MCRGVPVADKWRRKGKEAVQLANGERRKGKQGGSVGSKRGRKCRMSGVGTSEAPEKLIISVRFNRFKPSGMSRKEKAGELAALYP